MHDPVDIRRRIDRLVARVDRRDDYGQLLASGQVIYRLEDVDDIEAWRAEIRRQARADEIKVRTGFNDGIVWALRFRADQPGGQAEVGRYRNLLRRTVPVAVELRHEPSVMLRDDGEVICACGRCSAVGYGDAAGGTWSGRIVRRRVPQ